MALADSSSSVSYTHLDVYKRQDFHILRLTQGLYDRYQLKRVFYSAYVPVVELSLIHIS